MSRLTAEPGQIAEKWKKSFVICTLGGGERRVCRLMTDPGSINCFVPVIVF